MANSQEQLGIVRVFFLNSLIHSEIKNKRVFPSKFPTDDFAQAVEIVERQLATWSDADHKNAVIFTVEVSIQNQATFCAGCSQQTVWHNATRSRECHIQIQSLVSDQNKSGQTDKARDQLAAECDYPCKSGVWPLCGQSCGSQLCSPRWNYSGGRQKFLFWLRPSSHRMRKQVCAQICTQILWSCRQCCVNTPKANNMFHFLHANNCKQHQRICKQICVQICLRVLCELGLKDLFQNFHSLWVWTFCHKFLVRMFWLEGGRFESNQGSFRFGRSGFSGQNPGSAIWTIWIPPGKLPLTTTPIKTGIEAKLTVSTNSLTFSPSNGKRYF